MTHFLNRRETLVADALDGLLLAPAEPGLARLDGDPEIRVVLRAERDRTKVAVISGGGAGHEPAHAGFVGEGLLDAAVCGDIFASPSVDAVLAAILAVAGPAGCLLVVKNYVGDRINFGLAAEKARALGHAVEVVIVGDDVALPDSARPRGIAGTVLVHKAAGHAAAAGQPLAAVRAAAEATARAVRTLGVATATCAIPGQGAEARIPAGEAELGLGIHGEPGVQRIALPPLPALVADMVGRFGPEIREAPQLALLVNNLGGVSAVEMAAVAREVLRGPLGPRIAWLLGPAPVVTALDMRGFSLSLMPVDAAAAAMLTAPVRAPAWPAPRRVRGEAAALPLPAALRPAPDEPSADPASRRLLEAACRALIAAQPALDALDARVGDGDTGTTFASGARRVLAEIDALPLAEPAALCRALAERLSRAMGGSSGVLLSILLAEAGHRLREGADPGEALAAGVARMQFYGGAREGDRTMLDALLPAARALAEGGGLAAAARAARAGAQATAAMAAARSGRSSYLGVRDLAGTADPGAEAVARAFEALAEAASSP
ncbi:dihydroxyacetone kinase subunit DhaK [Methylobacterium sp. WSM2598]|uniref:dihydroxyacetone kinase subunit DhaK n=1 Tax=Methylobacterium sp. WSM2598 TaxID=398261 RepID=UPI000380A775|nr:dihydroxyacetone kinase subunit DhaK [Methylobacterium sp. WSM2598]